MIKKEKAARILSKYNWPLFGFIAAMLAIVVLRLNFLSANNFISADTKNYLVSMHQVFGNDITGRGLQRPPLVMFPLRALVIPLGPIRGSRVLSVLISVGIGFPMFRLCRRFASPWPACLTAILYVLLPMYSDMLAWGYITFFGIFFALLAFHFMLEALETDGWQPILAGGLMSSLIMGCHQTSLIIFALITVAFAVLLMLLDGRHRRGDFINLGLVAVAGVVLALPYVPSYLSQASNVSTGYLGSLWELRAWEQVYQTLWDFYLRQGTLWRLIVPLGFLGAIYLARQDVRAFCLCMAALFVPLILNLFDAADIATRAAYFSYFPVLILFCAGVHALAEFIGGFSELRLTLYVDRIAQQEVESKPGSEDLCQRVKRVRLRGRDLSMLGQAGLTLLAAIFLVWAWGLSQGSLERASHYYHTYSEEQVAATAWIEEHTPVGATFAAHPITFADWIRGLAQRNTYGTMVPARGAWEEQAIRARAAMDIFAGSEQIKNGNIRVATAHRDEGEPWLAVGAYLRYEAQHSGYRDLILMSEENISLGWGAATESTSLPSESFDPVVTGEEEDPSVIKTRLATSAGTVLRTVRLDTDQPIVALRYELESPPDTPYVLRIPIRSLIADTTIQSDDLSSAKLTQKADFGKVKLRINLEEGDDSRARIWETGYLDDDLVCRIQIDPEDSAPWIYIEPILEDPEPTESITYTSAEQLLREYGIDYLAFAQKSPSRLGFPLSPHNENRLRRGSDFYLIYSKGDIKIYQYAAPSSQKIERQVGAGLGEQIALAAYRLPTGSEIRAGEHLHVTLQWESLTDVDANFSAFAHLLSSDGTLVAQHDNWPQYGDSPTVLWSTGDQIADKHSLFLPRDLEPGRYRLAVGMYNPDTLERLPLRETEEYETEGDVIFLQEIEVNSPDDA